MPWSCKYFFSTFILFQAFAILGAEPAKIAHTFTNYYHFGVIKEIFTAYTNNHGYVVKDGLYSKFDEDGRLACELRYLDGKLDSDRIDYYPNGKKSWEIAANKETGVLSEKVWNREGELIANGTLRNGARWNGTFVTGQTLSISRSNANDTTFKISTFKNGYEDTDTTIELKDSGAKWGYLDLPINEARLLRWDRLSDESSSKYPYAHDLPAFNEIPKLLKWLQTDKYENECIYSQLVTLSRTDLGNLQTSGSYHTTAQAKAYELKLTANRWQKWWDIAGRFQQLNPTKALQPNSNVWHIIPWTNKSPPALTAPVILPDEWVLKMHLKPGDYLAESTETLVLHRSPKGSSLVRLIRSSKRSPVTFEQWTPFTTLQADEFAGAVAYAIDRPWLLQQPQPRPQPGIRTPVTWNLDGRRGSMYYPETAWNLSDADGNIWWNSNPTSWYEGQGQVELNHASLERIGSVTLLIAKTYPDNGTLLQNRLIPGKWAPLKQANAEVLEAAVFAIQTRDWDALNGKLNSSQLDDALDVLMRFGDRTHIGSIQHLIEQCDYTLDRMGTTIAAETNGNFTIDSIKNIRTKAKEVIEFLQQNR